MKVTIDSDVLVYAFIKHLHRIDRDWESPDTINMTLTEARKFVEELGRELRVMVVKSYENKNNL
ncbi:hypothetical protein METP2_02473 [Methanosarcinales archaeon]|nr:hypothetical protein [Candidatus Methanoperedens sp.]CAG0989268.1 hypothetical protein METP2_02473 [Methanosarcinales archaeon]